MFSIPYFQFTSFQVGPVTISVWGLFVALGILLSFYIFYRQTLQTNNYKLQNQLMNLFLSIIIIAFIGARLGHVFLYEWSYYQKHLLEILFIWKGGLSSFGGFVGAALVLYLFYRRYKNDFSRVADWMAYAFPWGWAVGRVGCFMIHDHPGVVCPSCFLPLQYPDGSLRPDLGLYEAILALIIGLILLIGKKSGMFKKTGSMATMLILLYALPRFFLDFLRATDLKILYGLTAAQYFSIIFAVLAVVYLLLETRHKKFMYERD